MEKASPARQTQGLCHSVTPGKDFHQSVRQSDTQNKDLRKESVAIPPALSEQLPPAHTIRKKLRSERSGWMPSVMPERGLDINLPGGGGARLSFSLHHIRPSVDPPVLCGDTSCVLEGFLQCIHSCRYPHGHLTLNPMMWVHSLH